MVKNLSASAGDIRDAGLIPESGTHFSILAWRIPWTEEPGGLWPRGSKELDTTEAT